MQISFLQWNIFFKEDPHNIAKLIKETNPDIVTVQELIQNTSVNPPVDTAKLIAESIGYNYVYIESATWEPNPDKTSQGNGIFSRYPITHSSRVFIQKPNHNPPDAAHEGRVYVEAAIDIKGAMLSVGTTHMSFTPFFEITENRKKEADNLIDVLKSKTSRYIFAADLNAVPDSSIVKGISEYLTPAGPDIVEKTWTTKPFDKAGMKEDKLNWRLDYVFSTKDLKVISAEIIKTDFSDHLPILVNFEI